MQINRLIQYSALLGALTLAISILPNIAGAQVINSYPYTNPYGSSYYNPYNWSNTLYNPLPFNYGQSFYGGGLYNGQFGRSFDRDDIYRQNRYFPNGDFRRSFDQGQSFDRDRDMNHDRDAGNQNRDHH